MTQIISFLQLIWFLFLRIARVAFILLVLFDMLFGTVGIDTVMNLLLVVLITLDLKGQLVVEVTECSCGHGADSKPVQPDRGSINKKPTNGGGA